MVDATAYPRRATKLADLDLLVTAVSCTADDLLPERKKNAWRWLTDAEVVALCVAQSIMAVTSDAPFRPARAGRWGTCSPP